MDTLNAHIYKDVQNNIVQQKNRLKDNLCRRDGRLDVVSIKRSIHTMGLFLNGHRELLERFNVEPTLPDDSSKFSG